MGVINAVLNSILYFFFFLNQENIRTEKYIFLFKWFHFMGVKILIHDLVSLKEEFYASYKILYYYYTLYIWYCCIDTMFQMSVLG